MSDVASAVRTAELTLELQIDDRVFDHYLQTVLVDAEELGGLASDSFGSKQPPPAERRRYDAVTGEFDDAATLLATVRIAVVNREAGHYAALAAKLADVSRTLARLESDLQNPPINSGR